MKGINPLVHGDKVMARVHDPGTDRRLIRRFRHSQSYGGCTAIDVVGCNLLCSYCFVDRSFLTGRGQMLARETAASQVVGYSPRELAEACQAVIERRGWPKRLEINAGEPFLTPDWLLETVDRLRPFLRANRERLWLNTNGLVLARHPDLVAKLRPYRDFLRLFVSSKHAPKFYEAMTNAAPANADAAFTCLERLWQNGLSAFLQAPMANLFFPETFEWYFQRLVAIHPNAPLLLDIDRLSPLPQAYTRSRRGLEPTGLWNKRLPCRQTEVGWQTCLEAHYGRSLRRLISVDDFPEDEKLVQKFILADAPTDRFPLFR